MPTKIQSYNEHAQSVIEKIEAEAPAHVEKYLHGIADGLHYNNFKKENAEKLIKWHYDLAKMPMPEVVIAENPVEFNQLTADWNIYSIEMFTRTMRNMTNPFLQNRIEKELFHHHYYKDRVAVAQSMFLGFQKPIHDIMNPWNTINANQTLYTASWQTLMMTSWKSFMIEVLGMHSKIEKEFKEYHDIYMNSGVYNTMFSPDKAVVVKYPKAVFYNAEMKLENRDGRCMIWGHSEGKEPYECHCEKNNFGVSGVTEGRLG